MSESIYKVTDKTLVKVTNEIEWQCTSQTKALSILGGHNNLKSFGMLEPFA